MEELVELGLQAGPVSGGVEARGSAVLVNQQSRLASRVWWVVARVRQPTELKRVKLPLPGPFRLDGVSREWVAAAEAAWGRGGPSDVEVSLHVDRSGCAVRLDTSGELLHFRGYRQEVGRAPMRETLAAAVLRSARFDPHRPLWDVMCGSGTLAIEAAEWAAGLAPGRSRSFAFERWTAAPALQATPRGRAPILATDLNSGALGTARRNARRAGVLEALTLERCDATALTKRELAPGLVVANLPYGKRVGAKSELAGLYARLGASLRRACAGWRFAFLLEEGAEHLNLSFERRVSVSNGGLRCEVVLGEVPRPSR